MLVTELDLPKLQAELDKRFSDFEKDLEAGKPVLGKVKFDKSLFAYFFFRNNGEPFRTRAFQDVILNDEGKLIILDIARQRGKSTAAAIEAVHTAYFVPDSLTIIISKDIQSASELLFKIKTLLESSEIKIADMDLFKKQIVIQQPGTRTAGRILVMAAGDAARGYAANKVILDEFAFMDDGDYILTRVVFPTLSNTNGKLMVLSSPNGDQGKFYELYKAARDGNDWSGYQFGWEVHPNKQEIEKGIEFIKRQYLFPEDFESEMEAKFVSSKNVYFNRHEIESAIHPELNGVVLIPEGSPVGVSCDFGKLIDPCVINVGYVRNPEAPFREQVLILVENISLDLGTSYEAVIERLRDTIHSYNPVKVCVDSTGVGEGPTDLLKGEFGEDLIEGVKFSLKSKQDIYSGLKILFQQKRIQIPKEEELIRQLRNLRYEMIENSKNKRIQAPDGEHDDHADALALLAHALVGNDPMPGIRIVTSDYSPFQKSEVEAEANKGKSLICPKCEDYYWSSLGCSCNDSL